MKYNEYTPEFIKNEIMTTLGCSEVQANIIYNKAFELGHSDGVTDVYWYATELCDIIDAYIRAK